MDFSLITYHFIIPMLEFFKKTLGSYGWAIIAVTILVKAVLYPLTKHQTQSMQKMQALQPKIKILQDRFNQQKDRYKDRPEKLKELQAAFQKDMMEFYQTNKVNPLGGCFPMLFQLPILIALFWAFNGSPFKPVAITAQIQILNNDQAIYEQIKGSSKPAIYIGKKGERGRLVLNPGDVRAPAGKEVTFMVYKLEGNINGVTNNLKWDLSDKPYYIQNYVSMDLSSFADTSFNNDGTVTIKTKKPGHIYLNAVLPASSQDDKFLFISGLGKTNAVDPASRRLNLDVIFLVLL